MSTFLVVTVMFNWFSSRNTFARNAKKLNERGTLDPSVKFKLIFIHRYDRFTNILPLNTKDFLDLK